MIRGERRAFVADDDARSPDGVPGSPAPSTALRPRSDAATQLMRVARIMLAGIRWNERHERAADDDHDLLDYVLELHTPVPSPEDHLRVRRLRPAVEAVGAALSKALARWVLWECLAFDLHPPAAAELDEGIIRTLVELARSGREEDFRWLAQSQGVRAEELDTLWSGSVARARRQRPQRRP